MNSNNVSAAMSLNPASNTCGTNLSGTHSVYAWARLKADAWTGNFYDPVVNRWFIYWPLSGGAPAQFSYTWTPVANLSVTKTDGQASDIPGTSIQYTVVAANAGPNIANNANIVDTIPAALTGATWTCSASAGSSCGSDSGSGNLNTTANLAVSGSATYVINATISAGATGSLANTATINPPAGTNDTTPGNNSATDTNALTPQVNLSVSKSRIGGAPIPGTTLVYQVVVVNSGPSNAPGTSIVDTLPAALASATWTCSASAGSSCGAASGSGSVNTTANIAAGGSVTYVINAVIVSGAIGNLTNSATATPGAGVTETAPGDNTSTDTVTLTPQANLSITKSDSAASAVPGTTIQYTVNVVNAGPSDVTGARVVDTLPAALTGATWTCTASAGSSCGAASGSGTASLVNTTANLLAGGSVTYVINATIAHGATGSLSNIASVSAPGGTTETAPGDNSATDTDSLTPQVNLSVVKTLVGGSPTPGTVVVYQVIVANAGPSNAVGVSVVDTLPAALTGATWTCSASVGTAVCGAASGSGNINTTATLFAGGSVSYLVQATIDPAATGTLTTVTPPRRHN